MMRTRVKLSLAAILFSTGLAHAASLVWDADPTTAGAQDGTGIWDTTGTNWWDGAANPAWINGTNTAVFGATNSLAGSVALAEPVTLGGISFTNTGGGSYSIDGTNTLTLIGSGVYQFPAITVAAGVTGSISANITSTTSNGYKKGFGTLNLSGTVLTTGREFHFDGGVVNYSGPSWNARKFLVGSTFYVGPAAVLNWSGIGTASNDYCGIGDNGSGTMNMNGGSFIANNGAGMFIGNNINYTGILNVAGGTFACVSGPLFIGSSFDGRQTFQPTWGYLNISNGTFNFTGSMIQLTGTNNQLRNVAQVNLDGGTFNLNGAPITNGVGTNVFNFNGGVLRLTANNGNVLTVQRANVRNGGAIFDFASGVGATVGQVLEHSNIGGDNAVDGGLTKRGTNSTLTLTGNNAYNGGTRINAGVLQMGGGGNSGTVGPGDVTISNNAQFVFRRSDPVIFSNKVTGIGNGGVLLQATGTVTIVGTNNSWGLTYPQIGTLEFDLGSGTFTGTGKFSMNGTSNATVNWKSGTGNLATGDFITFADNISGTSTLNVAGGTLNFYNTANRVLIGNQGVGIVNVSGGTLNIGNGGTSKVPIYIGGDTQYDWPNAQGFLNISGTGTVVIAGGSTLTLGANTAGRTNATGTINLDGGTLQLARDITRSNGLAYVNFNGGLLKTATNSATFIPWLTRANVRNGGAIIDTSLGSVTIGQPLEHSNIGGDNAIDGGLTKAGTGSLTLTNACTYNGQTSIANGTLALAGDGSILSSTGIVIQGGATLSVTGRTDGTLTITNTTLSGIGTVLGNVNNLGTISPGLSTTGALAVSGNVSLTPSSSLNIDIASTSDSDQLIATGTMSLDGALNVAFINGYTGSVGDAWFILSASSIGGAFASTNLPAPGTGKAWDIQNFTSFVMLSLVSAPTASGYDLYALQITNAADRACQADPDGDGYANLLEYATGGNPTNADQTARMNGMRTNGVLALQFTRATNSTDATLIVEGSHASTNDATWAGIAVNSNGAWSGSAVVTEGAGNPAAVTVQDTDATATNRFLRLRVTRP